MNEQAAVFTLKKVKMNERRQILKHTSLFMVMSKKKAQLNVNYFLWRFS